MSGPRWVRPSSWEKAGQDWPNREFSRFVDAAGLTWHVQVMGAGPAILLVHGTGAATHSWRDLAPLLARHFTVVAPDLPGHGFTSMPRDSQGLTLPGMAAGITALLQELSIQPAMAAGHSAGAAILVRMGLDGRITPRCLVSLNGALLPLGGVAGHLFSPLAKLLTWTGIVPQLFAWHASDPAVVERLLRDTGSRIDARGTELYARLARRPKQVEAAFGMMAGWDLEPLERDLPGLQVPLVLVVGSNDGTIRPAEAARVQRLLPSARIVPLPGLGHLAHEERPAEVAELIVKLAG